jgi:transketolase
LHEGGDVVLMNSGVLLPFVLEARELLRAEGIDAAVVNMPTVKPIDQELVIQAAREAGAIVTVENHNIMGGFGSAVAEVLVEHEPVPMHRVGIQDTYGESAPNEELAEKYGLTAPWPTTLASKVVYIIYTRTWRRALRRCVWQACRRAMLAS